MYAGFGMVPDRYDPRADDVDELVLRRSLQQMRKIIALTASAARGHREFIARHCAANDPAAEMAT